MITSRRILASVGLLAAIGTLSQASPAEAANTAVIKLAPGVGGQQVNGNAKKNASPGNEQAVTTAVQANGKSYLVTLFMSGNIKNQNTTDNVNQCKCSSVELTAQGPKIVADQVQLTNNRGDRPCNHPAVTADEAGNVVWVEGDNRNNATNVSTYAGVLDATCNTVVAPNLRISDGNGNDGAPAITYVGNGLFQAGYLNNGQTTQAVGLKLANGKLTQLYDKEVVNPANIGRPQIVADFKSGQALLCAAKGDQRPPEDGVECALLDSATGNQLWKGVVAASNPSKKMYANQPSIARLDNGVFAIGHQWSNGGGKNDNNKGADTSEMLALKFTAGSNTPTQVANIAGANAYSTHAAICGGAYGADGQRVAAIMGAPASGNGQTVLQMFKFSSGTNAAGAKPALTTDLQADKWISGFYGDSGFMSNIYGQNPRQQGREFMSCIGDVANPGYHVANGFMADVSTFFVVPHTGRVPGDYKNALWLGLVPAKADAALPPEGPKDPADIPLGNVAPGSTPPAPGNPNAANPNNPSNPTNPGATAGTPNASTPNDNTGAPAQPASGCACSVPSTGSSADYAGGVALLGLGLVFASRRRRNEV